MFSNINASGGADIAGVLTGSGSFDALLAGNGAVQTYTYDAVSGATIVLAAAPPAVPESPSVVSLGALLLSGGISPAVTRRGRRTATASPPADGRP